MMYGNKPGAANCCQVYQEMLRMEQRKRKTTILYALRKKGLYMQDLKKSTYA